MANSKVVALSEAHVLYYKCRSAKSGIEHEFKLVTDLDDLVRRYFWTIHLMNEDKSFDVCVVDYIPHEFLNPPYILQELINYG